MHEGLLAIMGLSLIMVWLMDHATPILIIRTLNDRSINYLAEETRHALGK